MIAATSNGLYRPGQTLLHRLDPRVKVASCLLLVVLAFAAAGWSQLFPLVCAVALAVWLVSSQAGSIWRVCWMLRWLMLFTLLMHLLLSSGRTLWGLNWLSLDGLLTGGLVCTQMLLAIVVSALLATTTSSEVLTRTFGWFVQPLEWLGCKTEEWQKILFLTMGFLPAVQEEMHAAIALDVGEHVESTSIPMAGRWSVWSHKLHDFISRLMDRGDLIAHRIAVDEAATQLPPGLFPLLPMALHDQLFSLMIACLVVCYWFAG
ncbi:MAG: energy-coupling factor transporter transmembrane protein EcfT [Desulfuromonadales bacterium]|nr:energy-coupling factor transporter transmembrane protein EcfT [Desulfuromonadales bacterium]